VAKKIITQTIITDDFDGKEIQDGLAEELTFSFDGADYRIDLRPENSAKLRKDLEKWVAAAQKVSGRRGRPRKSVALSNASKPKPKSDKEHYAAVRTWAKSQKLKVSDRGRISTSVLAAFEEAH